MKKQNTGNIDVSVRCVYTGAPGDVVGRPCVTAKAKVILSIPAKARVLLCCGESMQKPYIIGVSLRKFNAS